MQASQEEPVGDHLQLRVGGAALLAAYGKSDALTHRFSQACGQALSCGTGGETARFDHPDLTRSRSAVAKFSHQSQGNPGGFASSGWSLQQNGCSRLQLLAKRLQQGIDREGRQAGDDVSGSG